MRKRIGSCPTTAPLAGHLTDLAKTIPVLEPLLDAFFEACDAMNTRSGSVRRSAAHSIFLLEPRLPHLISLAQGRAAGGICGCRRL
jgi:hypothetical protein